MALITFHRVVEVTDTSGNTAEFTGEYRTACGLISKTIHGSRSGNPGDRSWYRACETCSPGLAKESV